MICILGSHALNKHNPTRRPIDLDLVATYDDLMEFSTVHFKQAKVKESYPIRKGKKWVMKGDGPATARIVETEIAWPDSLAAELMVLIDNDPKSIRAGNFVYASLDVLYMLKMSHRYLRNSPHFLKTMRDIHVMRAMGAKIRKEHKDFYKRRMKATYYYKHPSLEQGKGDFFKDDGIKYYFDHDNIHTSVALGDAPAYTYFQADNAEVQCDMKKFFACDEQIRLNAGCEESMVLSIERAVQPFGVDSFIAFKMALMKVCTSITSGKFREFCWENYDKILAMYDEKVYDKFWNDVKNDKVALHNSKTKMFDNRMAA